MNGEDIESAEVLTEAEKPKLSEVPVRNARHTNDGKIDCEIEHPAYSWIPFTASADDSEEHGREIYRALVSGKHGEIAPYLAAPLTAGDIAARRYAAEVSGIEVGGMPINTDDRSKLLVNGAALEATIDPGYSMKWKTHAGFVELSAEQVIGISRAVRAHVQACFDREAELLSALSAGTLTHEMLEQGWP